MGLAPYGKPIYADLIKNKLLDIKDDGSFRLNQDYFDYSTGFKMTNEKFSDLFKNPPENQNQTLKKYIWILRLQSKMLQKQ